MSDALRLVFRILWRNLGTLALALALSVAVWVSAVVADDPNVERSFPRPVTLELRSLEAGLVVVGEVPVQVSLRLRAPQSLWDRLTSETGILKAYLDLTGLGPGDYVLPVNVEIGIRPVQVLQQLPTEVALSIERLIHSDHSVTLNIVGEPALGYLREQLIVGHATVSVSGPESLVSEVAEVVGTLDVSGARADLMVEVELRALDEDQQVISGVDIEPATVSVTQTIRQAGGYRDVAVKVETLGQLASGYRVTNISVSPPTVTVFSQDPQLVAQMPGFVSTQPLDLSGADDDIETRLGVILPEGVTLVGDERSVLVQVGVAAIETSIQLSVQVEAVGLAPGLEAEISPPAVDLILSGSLPVLDSLKPEDVRIYVDLTNLGEGIHLVEVEGEILPSGVRIDSLTPASVEVAITRSQPESSAPLTIALSGRIGLGIQIRLV
jgi:YbbR domain-containing protein